MPLTGHLTELRNRILYILGTILVVFMGAYFFSTELLTFIQRPIAGQKLVFLSPTEAFFAHVKVSFFCSVFISLPIILFQIWRFCAPGLKSREKRYIVPFVFFSTLSFIVGALFCYFLILPYGLAFLLSFATESLTPQISVGFYISFAFKLIFTFGLVFEVPIVTILLVQIGVIHARFPLEKPRVRHRRRIRPVRSAHAARRGDAGISRRTRHRAVRDQHYHLENHHKAKEKARGGKGEGMGRRRRR